MIFQGKDIKEVWDYRLSYGVPQIVRRDTWQVEIYLKDNEIEIFGDNGLIELEIVDINNIENL